MYSPSLSAVLRTSKRQQQALTEATDCAPAASCVYCPEAFDCMSLLSFYCSSWDCQVSAIYTSLPLFLYTGLRRHGTLQSNAGVQSIPRLPDIGRQTLQPGEGCTENSKPDDPVSASRIR